MDPMGIDKNLTKTARILHSCDWAKTSSLAWDPSLAKSHLVKRKRILSVKSMFINPSSCTYIYMRYFSKNIYPQ
jgi:hypothetical protein